MIKLKDRFFKVGVKYIRAYLIIMLITFVIMLTGFLIMRVENALLLASVIALLDVLPLIGVGTVLVPWSVFQLLFGNLYLGIGLALIFVVNEVVRQISEPKIVGKSLGIHPLVSLVLLYVGYSVLGIAGLLLVPLISVILNVITDKNDAAEVA
jgi:predicted PurR-regulated permease PerM